MSTLILGAGMAGLAALERLCRAGADARVYERQPHWGGHTASLCTDGFVFDEGPHVSFTTDPQVRALFAAGAGEVREFALPIWNAFAGRWIRHPAQCHLAAAGPSVAAACVWDFLMARAWRRPTPNYRDWCYASFGRTFSERFSFPYTRKYWTVEPEQMTCDWIGNRVHRASTGNVVKGALGLPLSGNVHYFGRVRYPVRGGFQAFMRALCRDGRISVGKDVIEIDLRTRRVACQDGTSASFETLISTIPLTQFVQRIVAPVVPSGVRDAAARLLCTSLMLIDVALAHDNVGDRTLFYSYDEDVCFARAHLPHQLSAENVPPGRAAIQMEVYYAPGRPLPCAPEHLAERGIADLRKVGVVSRASDVLWARVRDVPFANVVFDTQRRQAVETVKEWIRSCGVLLAGRYGEWDYYWTDDAVRSGWAAADRVLSMTSGAAEAVG